MGKNINNYFTSMQQRFGTNDFIVALKPEQIQKSAKERIFREMVRGQIDYSLFGSYYEDPKFLDNLIIAANNEWENSQAIYRALKLLDMNAPGDIIVIRNLQRYEILQYIYSVISSRLYAIKMSGNIGDLTDIAYVLKDYSKHF